MRYQLTTPSPLGPLTLLGDDQALYGLWFADQQHFGADYDLTAIPTGSTAPLTLALDWLRAYFDGQAPSPFDLPLQPEVTDFRARVLQGLTQIPYGQTVTYQQLADQLGQPTAVRAVGGAVGHNPLSIVIPCHRVLGRHGELTGYAGGLDRKIALLTLEGHDAATLTR
ncbi:6-O-methylguanine DNA methyltransferase [Levilactobacillus zymae]|uniref:Methylated-DNA--protein-cysteine methyltransferase n=1 Tax=Levilactobacillus zymae TaxID=267363 RepID=A0ABQ0WZK7_9LACO|nr:methylated-DNA--[protein]-cysteine S-methyltransferase [Levilactobacillus zymae]KRL10811.1 6-O-methylguanine-DNA methyltransferase [Levilactobacillus zymae DSM 19395]QFR61836.1 methylated-DNA--[protein]-cysteine S-methyltransferase [Levilactobacillus zymae]GEO72471.1 6-O-methylguanine DNA methyltransferase [Levilactobacillus zymae]